MEREEEEDVYTIGIESLSLCSHASITHVHTFEIAATTGAAVVVVFDVVVVAIDNDEREDFCMCLRGTGVGSGSGMEEGGKEAA